MFIRVALPSLLDELIDASETPVQASPAVDVLENENESVIVAEIPGVAKEDVSVTLERNILTFSGERKAVQVPENARVLLHEQKVRSFRRSLRIPHDVERSAISASLENGLLRIVLPKAEEARATQIEIKVN